MVSNSHNLIESERAAACLSAWRYSDRYSLPGQQQLHSGQQYQHVSHRPLPGPAPPPAFLPHCLHFLPVDRYAAVDDTLRPCWRRRRLDPMDSMIAARCLRGLRPSAASTASTLPHLRASPRHGAYPPTRSIFTTRGKKIKRVTKAN